MPDQAQAQPSRLNQALSSACALLGVTFVAAYLATSFGARASEDDVAAAVTSAMDKALPAEMAQFSFEDRPYRSEPASIRVFRGKDATILMLDEPQRVGGLEPRLMHYGLGQTKGGSYFTFSYVSDLHAADEIPLPFFPARPCVEASCRRIESARAITVDQAKGLYFNSSKFTPERYKALFNEDAPAKRVDA